MKTEPKSQQSPEAEGTFDALDELSERINLFGCADEPKVTEMIR